MPNIADGSACHYCGAPAQHSDHIVPRSKGGVNAAWNRVPACNPCGTAKGADMPTCQCPGCRLALDRWYSGKRRAGMAGYSGHVGKGRGDTEIRSWADHRNLAGTGELPGAAPKNVGPAK